MSYTTNEKLPLLRAQAVNMVRSGKSTREVARYFGYVQSTIVKWCQKAPKGYVQKIETRSSVPISSPLSLPKETVGRIIHARIKSHRCAEVVFEMLKKEGVEVSLSSVKRKLSRYGLLKKRSPWKKIRRYRERPDANMAGMLVEIDTVHFVDGEGKKVYVFTALDVYSRYGFALLSNKSNCLKSCLFVLRLLKYFPFKIQNIQTDNGSEFGLFFTDFLTRHQMKHRHIHPRSPNENGHVERFNRTLQEEIGRHGWCIFIPEHLSAFLSHYNTERMHMGINFKTPAQLIQK